MEIHLYVTSDIYIFVLLGSENNSLYVYYKGVSKQLLTFKFDTIRGVMVSYWLILMNFYNVLSRSRSLLALLHIVSLFLSALTFFSSMSACIVVATYGAFSLFPQIYIVCNITLKCAGTIIHFIFIFGVLVYYLTTGFINLEVWHYYCRLSEQFLEHHSRTFLLCNQIKLCTVC